MSSPNFLNLNPQQHRPSTVLNQDSTSAVSTSPQLQPTDLVAQEQVNTKTSRSSSNESADSVTSADISIGDEASRVQQGQFLRLGQH